MTLGYELACRTAIAQHSTTLENHTSGSWVAVAVAPTVGEHQVGAAPVDTSELAAVVAPIMPPLD